MAATLKVVDEHFGASAPVRRTGMALRLASERVSARDIIRSRVSAEVEEMNARKLSQSEGPAQARSYLVEPASPEAMLNAVGSNARRRAEPLDVEAEVKRTLAAFSRRRFIMLLDDRQIDNLDETVGLRPDSEAVFVHLTPLKGG
jgi:hypothetical protein